MMLPSPDTAATHRPPCERGGAFWLAAGILIVWGTGAAFAQDRVSQTAHNLSVSGPGRIRAVSEQQVCIFCHAPHNTQGVRPLWNRELPATSYRIYQSSTLDAKPGQPTGSSKLCLSCHDGTIALGSVLSHADRIRMSGGDFMPAGLTNLGTDLSDDHPISFYYGSGLAASDRQLASPQSLPKEAKLDADGELQCTSCHNPHNNAYGDFLVMRNEFGVLCATCHRMNGWSSGSHRLANTSVSGIQGGDWPFTTVAENACRSCHRPHTAGGHQRLLIKEKEEDNCLICHSGQVASRSISSELNKPSAHDPRRYLNTHDPAESRSGSYQPHVECTDCHNPHAVQAQLPMTGYVPIGATLLKTAGVNISGTAIEEAVNEYEVCFRCHADSAVPVNNQISRQNQTPNLRLAFSRGNPSFHPVTVSSVGHDVVSLVPGLAPGSLIRCTDCHNNNAGPRAGGTGPDGPHGSIYDYLLERNYSVRDDSAESAAEYALCYKCHQRSSILSDQSFPWHRKHIVEEQTPCSACHDPHGVTTTTGSTSSDHTHLINFDITIVRPNQTTRTPVYRDLGRFAGSCTLLCHGTAHDNETYGVGGASPQRRTSPRTRSMRLR